MRRRLPALALLIAASCGGGSGRRSPPPAGYTGELRLERYRTYLPANPVTPFLFAQATFQGPDNAYLPAGARIALVSGAQTIPMVRIDVFGKILYQRDPQGDPLPLTDFLPDATYSMQSEGAHENFAVPDFTIDAAVATPAAFALLSPNLQPGEIITDGTAAIPLSWTAGNGDYVLVILAVAAGGQGHYVSFKADDNGAFSIPVAGGLDQLPAGIGSLTVERIIERPLLLPDGGTGKAFGGDAVSVRLVRN